MRYSEESRIRILRHLEFSNFEPLMPAQATDLTPEELNQLNYVILSLKAFYSQKNKYHTKKTDLIPLLVNIDGAKYLKRMKLKSFLESSGSKLIEVPSWWNDIKSIPIEDIGEIYNFNYCFFWEAPDEQDYLLSQLPVGEDPVYVKKFSKQLDRIMEASSEFNYVKREEILLRVSTSKSLVKGESIPNYVGKYKNLNFSTRRKAGKRVLITTGPGQGRDAVINEIDDLNTIQLINENVRNFLEANLRKFLLIGNAEDVRRRYFRACKKSKFFYARDIKKEGITKPKYLLKMMLEALHKRYPDNEAFQFTDFFDGPWFNGDMGNRGHGLGMANELTTLMQIAIFLLTNRELSKEGSYVGSTRAFFLNDDAIIFFDEEDENNDDFIDMDFFICEKLGVFAQKDKSFSSSTCCVFCEMYYSNKFPNINDKESYFLREQEIILRSGSILEVKFLLGNLKGSLSHIEEILKKAFVKFGYEFSQNELDWPISMGGMRPTKLRGTDFSLQFVESLSTISTVYRAYIANKNRKLWSYNKFLKEFESPLFTLYPALIKEDKDILMKLGYGDYSYLSSAFFRPTKEHKFHSSLRRLFEKRKASFERNSGSLTFELFCEEFTRNSLSNCYLPEPFIEREIPVKLFTMKDFQDPYTVKNPLSSFLKLRNLIKDDDIPATKWGLYSTDASLLHEKSVAARSRTFNTLSFLDRFEEDIDIDLLVFPENPEDIPDFMEAYPKPFLTSELVRKGNKLPIPKKNFWNPDLKMRKEVFGEYLKHHHILLAQVHSWREIMGIIDFEKLEIFEFDFEFWTTVFRNVAQKKKDDEKPFKDSSSDEDDDDDPFSYKLSLPVFDLDKILSNVVEAEKAKYHSTSSDEDVIILGEENIEEEVNEPIDYVEQAKRNRANNPFMKEHGDLPDGDLSVYGSVEWVKWYVRNMPADLMEYTANDEDLDEASVDFFAHYRRKLAVSDLISAEIELKNVISSAKYSWISHYYHEYIYEDEGDEDEIVEFDPFAD